MRLDSIADKIVIAAYNEAKYRKHEYFTPEHVLYASLFFDEGKAIIEGCGGNVEKIKSELQGYFEDYINLVEDKDPMETIGVSSMMQTAALHVISSGKEAIRIGDIFAALYAEKDSFAVYILESNGIRRLDVLKCISHGITAVEPGGEACSQSGAASDEQEDNKTSDFLSAFSTELVQKAQNGEIHPLHQ